MSELQCYLDDEASEGTILMLLITYIAIKYSTVKSIITEQDYISFGRFV